MNLLRTDTFELVHIARSNPTPPYAILSHRWEGQEITLSDIVKLRSVLLRSPSAGIPASLRGSATKIRGACAMAHRQGLGYIWIDTCCIDKSNGAELAYALNRMYHWYRGAVVCYTYLNDVSFERHSEKMFMSDRPDRRGLPSEWFERGWTLQELLAPQKMQFYDKGWKYMGTRNALAVEVGRMAGISPEYLSGKRSIEEANCATKMSWMAARVTQKVEDIAYSLIGLFGVHLEPLYGEGTRAFERLQRVILSTYGVFDESLFAWKTPSDSLLRCYQNTSRARTFKSTTWGLLAPSPDCFKGTGSNVLVQKDLSVVRPGGGFGLSYQGTTFTLPSQEVQRRFGGARSEILFPLNCWVVGGGKCLETVVLKLARGADGVLLRAQCQELCAQKGAKVSSKGSTVIAVAQPWIAQF